MEEIRSILVRVPNWVGDAVMALPALAQLRAARPGARITAVAKPWVSDIVRLSQSVDDVVEYRPASGLKRAASFWRLVQAVGRGGYGAALLFQNAFEAAALAAAAGIPVRIGRARDGRRWLLTDPVPESSDPDRHQMHDYLDIVEKLAPSIPRTFQPLRLSEALLARGSRWLDADPGPAGQAVAAIAPGARETAAKRWPAKHFAAVADGLAASGARVVIIGSVFDRETAAAVTAAMGQPALDLTGRLTLAEALAVIAQAGVLVSNDSGAMHLGAAAGTPVAAVFGPTNPRATGPLGDGHRIFQGGAPAQRLGRRHSPADLEQLFDIDPADVLSAALTMLRQPQAVRPLAQRGC